MLITVDTLKTYLGISGSDQDSLCMLIVKNASTIIESYIGRTIAASDYTELHDGLGQTSFLLRNLPVNTVASIETNIGGLDTPAWEAVSEAEYSIDTNTGIVRFTSRMGRGLDEYRVSYNAGYDPIPYDLQAVCLEVASGMYNTRASNGVKMEEVAGDRIEYTGSTNASLFSALDKYRDVSF